MKEIKIGDWGWFWMENPDESKFSRVDDLDNSKCAYPYRSISDWYKNFSHEHPTGKFVVTENPNTVSNDPYAELKKAYEEGKTIQFLHNGIWEDWIPKWTFDHNRYRIKPEPRYRAYTFEDREEFKGRWVRFKPNTKIECAIIRITEDDVFIEGEGIISYEDAFSRYEYADGTPFGKSLTPSENISNTN